MINMDIKNLLADARLALSLPKLKILLDLKKTSENHVFYADVVRDFYQMATHRHPRFPLIRNLQYGVALMPLPENHDHYLKNIESSARRNIKKAQRKGYTFSRIDYNSYLNAIGNIHRSAPVRQGAMPSELLDNEPTPINNPETLTSTHDYPYFGIFKEDKLVAYAGCLVAGEMILLSTFFGHDDYKSDGIVPLLISEIAKYTYEHYPLAKYYVYDAYFGGSASLRRFKKKFGFTPYKVSWLLD